MNLNDQTNSSPPASSGDRSLEGVTMLAPDVGTIVEYGQNSFRTEPARYRVSSWMRAAPAPNLDPDDFIGQILFESCREFDTKSDQGRRRMQFCLREEATHVSLTGICGAIAPIDQCKVVGMVEWTEALLAEERDHANRLGATHEMLF